MIDTAGRSDAVVHIAKLFEYQHLHREDMRAVSKQCHDLAEWMIQGLPDGMELFIGLRKLVEAKDCFVRAVMENDE